MQTKFIVSRLVQSIQKHPLRAILILGLLHGLIYVFMIPPWWHHEEPGHFEYAWLAANEQGWPQPGDYDNSLRREIAESMFAIGQENLVNITAKNLDDDPIRIGFSPVGRKPIYPWIVSQPLRLVRGADVLIQLYAARLTSLALFVLSLWLTWLGMGEILAEKHPLRWMVPAFLALLPGYVDNMTAVHDDVIGAVAAALFLWLSVRWLKRGFSPLLLMGWLVSLVLCYRARETTQLLIVVAPLVPLLYLLRKKAVPILSIIIFSIAVVAGTRILTFQDAAQWYYFPAQKSPNRIETAQAPFGEYVFSLEGKARLQFGQSFSPEIIKSLRKKTLTLGVWIWADKSVQIDLPIIQYRTPNGLEKSPSQQIQVGAAPVFYTTTFYIPYEAGHTWLIPLPKISKESVRIYYDGFVLTEGEFSLSPPVFDDGQLGSGVWDGQYFVNLVRNPSAESVWLGFRKPFTQFRRSYIDLAQFLQTFQDIQGFGWYYKLAGSFLFQGFWGRGAAAQIPLMGAYTYALLRLIFVLSIFGIFKFFHRDRSLFLRHEIFFLGSVLIAVWMPTILRGATGVFNYVVILPYARYAFPAFIPTALLFNAGILEVLRWIRSRYDLPENFPVLVFLAFMGGLASYAIFSFGGYFYPWVLNSGYLILFGLLIGLFYIILWHMAHARENSAKPM